MIFITNIVLYITLLYELVIIIGPKSISFNQMHSAIGAGAIILDAGDKLLGV